jgi:hypothetical protein
LSTISQGRSGYGYPEPPPIGEPLDSSSWGKWFQDLYDNFLRDGTQVPSVTIGSNVRAKKIFADSYIEQELLSIDGGLFSNYSSDNGNIIYGFAANVKRFGGNAFTVGAQLNAYGGRDVSAGVWGIACEAWAQQGCTSPLIGIEPAVVSLYSENGSPKRGVDAVFTNRSGSNTLTPTLGSNLYNYNAIALNVSSAPRSGTGEFCGWTRGVAFYSGSMDQQSCPAWVNNIIYQPGMVVSSGGQAWQAIIDNTNVLPAVGLVWVLHNVGGPTAQSIGIDFSSMDLTTMGRMSSAIRLRDTMRFHWESTGQVGTYFDQVLGRLVLVENGGIPWLAVDVVNGFLYRNGVFLI